MKREAKPRRLRVLRRAEMSRSVCFCAEPIERRLFLSVSSSLLAGPELTKGDIATYAYTDVSSGTTDASGTYTITAVGRTTFNRQPAFESDDTTVSNGSTDVKKTYLAQTSQGLIEYGWVADGDITTIYNPPSVVFPATAVAGQTYTMVSTGTTNNSAGNITSFSDTVTAVLSSDTTQPITVGAGTYDCYVITGTTSNVPDITQPTQTIQYSQTFDIAAGVGLVQEQVVQSPDPTTGSLGFTQTYALSSYVQGDSLAFQRQPKKSSAGAIIQPPVTVKVVNSSGGTVTDATTNVTLALAGGSSTAELGGTLTEPVVNGVATFSDLVPNEAGTYTLVATDDDGLSVTSTAFTVKGNVLKFFSKPAFATANQPIHPAIEVEEVNYSGKRITADNSTTVTLLPTGALAANPISGNTAVMVSGLATFSNFVLPLPGTYILQALDATGDVPATSTKLKVTPITFGLLKLGRGYDVHAPMQFTVMAKDEYGRVDTSATGEISMSLNAVGTKASHSGAALSGVTVAPLVGGYATFDLSQDESITEPGDFTLTATNVTGSAGALTAVDSSKPVTSKPIMIKPDKLVVIAPPSRIVNAQSPFSFQVQLENAQGDLIDSPLDSVALTAVEALKGATGYVGKQASASLASGSAILTTQFYVQGEYKITVSAVSSVSTDPITDLDDYVIDSSITPVITGPVKSIAPLG